MKHVKELLKKYIEADNQILEERDAFVTFQELIDELQEAIEHDEKESGWIPVSERLPEIKKLDVIGSPHIYRTEKVFVQTKRGEIFAAWCHKKVYISKKFNDEYLWYTHGTGGRKMRVMSKVVAWRPLPELYKEG